MKKIKGFDIYGKQVTMTYKGKEKFKSQLGGFISMLLILFIFSLFLYKINDLVKRNQTQVKKNSLVSISNTYSPPYVISEKNITIAFKLANFYGQDIALNPYYGSFIFKQFQIFQHINATDGTSYRTFDTYIVPYSKCKVGSNFYYANKDEAIINGVESFYCPDWQNLTIQGNWNSPQYQGLTLVFERCTNANNSTKQCATDSEFNAWIKSAFVNEIYIGQYFSVTDYEDPVHSFIDNSFVSLAEGKSLYCQTTLMKSDVTLYDNIFGFFSTQTNDYFFSRNRNERFLADINEGPGVGMYFYQDFVIDKEYDTYERKVYTVVGVLQDVGGFYNALFFLGLLVYSKFQTIIYVTNLISQLYLQQSLTNQNEPHKKPHNVSHDLNDVENGLSVGSPTAGRGHTQMHTINETIDAFKMNGNGFSVDVINRFKHELLDRITIIFTKRDLLTIALGKLKCCKGKNWVQQSTNNTQALYYLGQKKILRELDIITILNKLRNLDTLLEIYLTKDQRELLKAQKKATIDRKTQQGKFSKNHSIKYSEKYQLNKGKCITLALQLLQNAKQMNTREKKLLFGLINDEIDQMEESNGVAPDSLHKQISIGSQFYDNMSFKKQSTQQKFTPKSKSSEKRQEPQNDLISIFEKTKQIQHKHNTKVKTKVVRQEVDDIDDSLRSQDAYQSDSLYNIKDKNIKKKKPKKQKNKQFYD